jgi:curved DNA-binding protein CbpA
VTDLFAVLGVPRRPCVDADELKERFHRLSARHHPDAAGGSAQSFTDLNTAWQTLRDPAKCLRHYLELTHPGLLAGADQTPADLADLFMDIAAFRQSAQKLAARLASASTPLTRALLEPERITLRAKSDDLAAAVADRTAKILASLREESPGPEALTTLLSSLVFLGKWAAHLAEARQSL